MEETKIVAAQAENTENTTSLPVNQSINTPADPSQMMQDLYPEEAKKMKWSVFVETKVADFFTGFDLEKMTIEDGNGNKAKLSHTKEGDIKIEYTSTITI